MKIIASHKKQPMHFKRQVLQLRMFQLNLVAMVQML
jgi:hypothetical protein